MQWQNWHVLGPIVLFFIAFVLMVWFIRWTERRDWRLAQREPSALQNYAQDIPLRREKLDAAIESCRALQSDSGQETSPIAIAESTVEKLLRAEFEIALGEWIFGPPEFELAARERIRSAVERSRIVLKYVDELQRQAE